MKIKKQGVKINYAYLDEVSENHYNKMLHDKRVKVVGDYTFILSKYKDEVKTEYGLFVCDDTADGIYNCFLEKYDLFEKVEDTGFNFYFNEMINPFLVFLMEMK